MTITKESIKKMVKEDYEGWDGQKWSDLWYKYWFDNGSSVTDGDLTLADFFDSAIKTAYDRGKRER